MAGKKRKDFSQLSERQQRRRLKYLKGQTGETSTSSSLQQQQESVVNPTVCDEIGHQQNNTEFSAVQVRHSSVQFNIDSPVEDVHAGSSATALCASVNSATALSASMSFPSAPFASNSLASCTLTNFVTPSYASNSSADTEADPCIFESITTASHVSDSSVSASECITTSPCAHSACMSCVSEVVQDTDDAHINSLRGVPNNEISFCNTGEDLSDPHISIEMHDTGDNSNKTQELSEVHTITSCTLSISNALTTWISQEKSVQHESVNRLLGILRQGFPSLSKTVNHSFHQKLCNYAYGSWRICSF